MFQLRCCANRIEITAAGVNEIVGPYIGPKDSLLTYLPQAHILEFMFENLCLFWGGTMGYGNPRTLADPSMRKCKGDIREFQPTILVGVPAVWESVKKGVLGKLNQANPPRQNEMMPSMIKSHLHASSPHRAPIVWMP